MTSWPVRHITVTIDRSPDAVYAFASDPRNLPRWATGLAGSIREVQGRWTADSPMGPVTIAFVEPNRFGVLDHDVTLPSGVTVHNPLRVLPNGTGSEVVFSLFRLPDVSDEQFAQDAAWVANDLQSLAHALEGSSP
jgi:predicted dienelactone hydrolase